jgi:hypothetical protein
MCNQAELHSGQNGAILSAILIKNCARTEDVLAINVRQEFLFRRKVGRDSTENKAILEQTLSVSTLHCDQNCTYRANPDVTNIA